MSHAIPFDTLAFAKKLESAGIAVEHARAYSEALVEVLMSRKQDTQKLVACQSNTDHAIESRVL